MSQRSLSPKGHGHFKIRIVILTHPADDEYDHLRGLCVPCTSRVSVFVIYEEAKRFLLLAHPGPGDAHEPLNCYSVSESQQLPVQE